MSALFSTLSSMFLLFTSLCKAPFNFSIWEIGNPHEWSTVVRSCSLYLRKLIIQNSLFNDDVDFHSGHKYYIIVFLTNRPEAILIGSHTSSTVVLNTGVLQCCAQPTRVHTAHTWLHGELYIIKYTDQTSVEVHIANNGRLEGDKRYALTICAACHFLANDKEGPLPSHQTTNQSFPSSDRKQ